MEWSADMKRWVVHVGYWHQMTMVAHLIHIWLEGVGAKTTEFKCWIIWKETASHSVAALISRLILGHCDPAAFVRCVLDLVSTGRSWIGLQSLPSTVVRFSRNGRLEFGINESANASTDQMILWQDPETKLFCNVTRCSLAFEDLGDYVRPLIGQVSTLWFLLHKVGWRDRADGRHVHSRNEELSQSCRLRPYTWGIGHRRQWQIFLILKKLAVVDLSEEALTDIRGDIWQSIQLALDDCQLRRRRICETAMQREEDTIIESKKRNHEVKKMIKIKADEITKDEQDIDKLSARLVTTWSRKLFKLARPKQPGDR